jgi:hypothetical protein
MWRNIPGGISMKRINKSGYVASLIEQDEEYRAWKGQAA